MLSNDSEIVNSSPPAPTVNVPFEVTPELAIIVSLNVELPPKVKSASVDTSCDLQYSLPSLFAYNIPPSLSLGALGDDVSDILILPVISNFSSGELLPIPTLPAAVILKCSPEVVPVVVLNTKSVALSVPLQSAAQNASILAPDNIEPLLVAP